MPIKPIEQIIQEHYAALQQLMLDNIAPSHALSPAPAEDTDDEETE